MKRAANFCSLILLSPQFESPWHQLQDFGEQDQLSQQLPEILILLLHAQEQQ